MLVLLKKMHITLVDPFLRADKKTLSADCKEICVLYAEGIYWTYIIMEFDLYFVKLL